MTQALDTQATPLRKSAQRLRWFLGAFDEQIARTTAETGTVYDVDRTALAEVFADWLHAFLAQKPDRVEDKAAYVGFAAGLMLRTLVRKAPVTARAKPAEADETNPAYFWPEGYLYVAFCLNVRGLVSAQDYDNVQNISDALSDTRTWWSFKENVERDPARAIAFLDLFAGDEPNWEMPDFFRTGRGVGQIAAQFYTAQIDGTREP